MGIKELRDFFKEKGIDVPENISQYSTSNGAQGFGNPQEWGNTTIIFIDDIDSSNGGYKFNKRYIYAPDIEKGAIITIDDKNMFMIEKSI